jgi:hypothetical protein
MQRTRAIPVAWLGSGSCQTGPRAEYPLLTFHRKSCRLWDNAENCCLAGQATDDNLRIRIVCWIPKTTQTHTQNMQYLFLLHGKNGYMNAPQCYVYTYNNCLVYIYIFVLPSSSTNTTEINLVYTYISAVWMRKYSFCHTVSFLFHVVITVPSDEFPKEY